MFLKFLSNITTLSMNYSITFLALTTFYGIIEIFYPIRWKYLQIFMSYFNIPFTTQNIIVTLSSLTLIIPIILSMTSPARRFICWNFRCRKPTPEENKYLERIVGRIKINAGIKNKNFVLYIAQDKDNANAYAIGNNIIAITQKSLDILTEEEAIGIIAHEVGHIENRDTNATLLNFVISSIGNLVICIYTILKAAIDLLRCIPLIGWPLCILSWILSIFIWISTWVLDLPATIITQYGSRMTEFNADLYACKIGFSENLYKGLAKICTGESETAEHLKIYDSHPAAWIRLKKIREYQEKQKSIDEQSEKQKPAVMAG